MVKEGFDGFLTPPSAKALAEKTLFLLHNGELRQRLGNQARESRRKNQRGEHRCKNGRGLSSIVKLKCFYYTDIECNIVDSIKTGSHETSTKNLGNKQGVLA